MVTEFLAIARAPYESEKRKKRGSESSYGKFPTTNICRDTYERNCLHKHGVNFAQADTYKPSMFDTEGGIDVLQKSELLEQLDAQEKQYNTVGRETKDDRQNWRQYCKFFKNLNIFDH